MPIAPRKRVADEKVHVGFGWNGSVIRSAVPVQNQPTAFVKNLIWRVQNNYCTAREIAQVIAAEKTILQALFPDVALSMWLKLDRYFLWPSAPSGSSAMTSVICRGAAMPPWIDDANAWEKHLTEAESYRGERPHLEYVLCGGQEYDVLPGEAFPAAIRRVFKTHGDPQTAAILSGISGER